jgi:hypothetical protein
VEKKTKFDYLGCFTLGAYAVIPSPLTEIFTHIARPDFSQFALIGLASLRTLAAIQTAISIYKLVENQPNIFPFCTLPLVAYGLIGMAEAHIASS